MNYEEYYREQVGKGAGKPLVSEIKTDWQQDETIVGVLQDIKPVEFEETNSHVNSYVFKTDRGLLQFIMGSGTDKQLEGKMEPGNIYACRFVEKKEIGKGRTLNVFDVIDLGKEPGSGKKS